MSRDNRFYELIINHELSKRAESGLKKKRLYFSFDSSRCGYHNGWNGWRKGSSGMAGTPCKSKDEGIWTSTQRGKSSEKREETTAILICVDIVINGKAYERERTAGADPCTSV